MLLARKNFTLGDKTQYTIDYARRGNGDTILSASDPIPEGYFIVTQSVTVSAGDVTISGAAIQEGRQLIFFVAGGSLNEAFTVTIQVTDNNSEIRIDTIDFVVVSP